MEKMLITGGNGFLGYHLAQKSISDGIDVTVLDDLSTSGGVKFSADMKFIREKVEETNIDDRFDYIVHLAARPSPDDYISNPVETLLSNSVGTLRMLKLARKYGSRFFYTSSSEVYGDAQIIPTPETYYGYVNPNGIRSCYDESKRFSEALIMAYHREYLLDTRIQRPFNVYGPWIRADSEYGRVIPRFIVRALKGEDIPVHGDGKQTRSFLYVDDWLEMTWKFLTAPDMGGEVMNVGSAEEVTIYELAEKIKGMTDSKSRIKFEKARENDPRRRAADTRRAENLLGWKPKVSLEDGLKKTIEWFRGRM
ncbi:MAG: GDP-mannose 4,6-dehydratase [Candidatus Parvarchaeota archaeon]